MLEPRNLLAVTVNTFDDAVVDDEFTSLREAIGLAAGVPGEVIELPTGTYELALGELSITDAAPLTIQSTGGQATIDALAASRVFSIGEGSDVTLRGLVITNGSVADSGGGIWNRGTVTIEDSVLLNNFSDFTGCTFSCGGRF